MRWGGGKPGETKKTVALQMAFLFSKAERIGERHSINRELITTVQKAGMNKERRERLN
jgi:hypothetical protein